MSLHPETLNQIVELAKASQMPESIDHGAGKMLLYSDGTIRHIEAQPRQQVRDIGTFDSFVQLVGTELSDPFLTSRQLRSAKDAEAAGTSRSDIGYFQTANEGPCVYISEAKFVYIQAPSNPYTFKANFAPCSSVESHWFRTESKNPMDQKGLIRTLRITLARCLLSKELISLVRNLKFKADTSGDSDLQHGRQSISRSIIKEVKGLDTIPESLLFQIKPFENINIVKRINVAIEIDEATETFKLTPMPGEWEKMIDDVLNECMGSMPERVIALRGAPNA